MRDHEKHEFITVLGAVLEVYGATVTPAAMPIWWEALRRFELIAVRGALSRHVQNPSTGRFAPKPADVIREIESAQGDGRPGAEEAWAICPKDEATSAMLTAEMREALTAAYSLIRDGDPIAARMTFREVYERAVVKARALSAPVRWEFCAGWNREGRIAVLAEGVRQQRITQERARDFLPIDGEETFLRLAGIQDPLLLAPPTQTQKARRKQLMSLLSDVTEAV